MQIENWHSAAEPEQSYHLVPTSPENAMQLYDSSVQSVIVPSIDDDNITSWISPSIQSDRTEFFDPQLSPGRVRQSDSPKTQENDDPFTTVLRSSDSSTPLQPLPIATMSVDSWMNLSPTTCNTFLPVIDHRQPPSSFEGHATLSDVAETATLPSSTEYPLMSAPWERGKTVLTLENLDPETRSEVLDWLCRRKVVTTIEIV